MPIPEHKLDALAYMAVNGFDAEKMARVTDLKVTTVRNLLSDGNAKFNALKEAYERKLMGAAVQHNMWMWDQVEDCRKGIENAIKAKDLRLSYEASTKHLDKLIPAPPSQQAAIDVNVNIQAQAEFTKTIIDMGKQFVELKEVLATQDPNKHIKSGAEALPRALKELPAGKPKVENEKLDLEESKS